MNLTPTQRLAEKSLESDGLTLRDFILHRADLGVPLPRIARQLAEATDGEVSVTGQAIRVWIEQMREQTETVAS